MQPPRIQKPCHSPELMVAAAGSSQLTDLALYIDAIPSEHREDVLLAVLRLATNKPLEQSYFVGSLRELLSDCFFQRTGTIHDLSMLRRLDRVGTERRLNLFTTAADPAQVTLALCGLLDFLIDAL